MKFGVIGLGSMGKRRARDLLSLGHRVWGYDVRSDRMQEAREVMEITTVDSAQQLLHDDEICALVISTPPDQHVGYYADALAVGKAFFSEANILTPRVEWLNERQQAANARGFPSATWRFHPVIQALRVRLENGLLPRVHSVHHQYGSFLPQWHPWEPYYEFYAGRARATSAAREMVPFELEWLCWLFGPVRAVCGSHSRRAKWATEIEDTYAALIEFERDVDATLVVELHQRIPVRTARISHADGAIVLDLNSWRLDESNAASDRTAGGSADDGTPFGPPDWEPVYLREIEAFAGAVAGEADYPKTWEEDRHLSDVLVALEQSHRSRRWVTVADVAEQYDGLDLSH